MSDPIGTVGSAPHGGSDFEIAAAGGGRFMQRLEQLAKARDAHDEALARLNLGQDTVAAHDAAQRIKTNATDLRQSAADVLATARADAAKMIDEATAKATSTVTIAEQKAAGIINAAKDEASRTMTAAHISASDIARDSMEGRQRAEVYATKVIGEANALMAVAKQKTAVATKTKQDAEAASAEAAAATAEANAARDAARRLHAKITNAAAAVRAAMIDL